MIRCKDCTEINCPYRSENPDVTCFYENFAVPEGPVEIPASGYMTGYIDGVTTGEKIGRNKAIEDICHWLEQNVRMFLNGDYNEFHHQLEYDGTVDTNRLLSSLKKSMGYEEQDTKR